MVGSGVGESVGVIVGESVGVIVGESVGAVVGESVGAIVGESVGTIVGESVGATVGESVAHVSHVSLHVSRTSVWSQLSVTAEELQVTVFPRSTNSNTESEHSLTSHDWHVTGQ